MRRRIRLAVSAFLILFGGLLAFFLWQRAMHMNRPLPAALPNGSAAGDVTQNSAVLWARSPATGALTFAYGVDLAHNPTVVTQAVISPLLPMTIEVAGLMPNTLYHYRVSNAQGDTVDGQFQTAAPVGAHTGLRFGVSGDWRGDLAPYLAIQNAPARHLKFFVELGDTIYADFSSPAAPANQATTLTDYRLKYSEVYSTHSGLNLLATLRANTALLATIDDHEVMNNFSGGAPAAWDERFHTTHGLVNETALYQNSMQAFQEYNPIHGEHYGMIGGDGRMDHKPKFYRYRLDGSDAALLMLDERSFRDPPVRYITKLIDTPRFLKDAFTPGRTILGTQQLQDLEHDLLDAQQKGVTWKFVAVPEPIQNLGPIGGEDRFEGYAAERTALLRFIAEQRITNVVFIAADIHGTLVNNLTYQTDASQPQQASGAFEVTVGPVAFSPTFGPTIVSIGENLGLITSTERVRYNALPIKNDTDSEVNDKDDFVKALLNRELQTLGYDPIGLDGSLVKATLLQGDYVAVHTFGWTEFEIAKDTQVLTITTYGVPAYTGAESAANARSSPTIVSQFRVEPLIAAPHGGS
ncbi:MAG: alkaline phosphatase D family protein [Caldilineaceae bacterium]